MLSENTKHTSKHTDAGRRTAARKESVQKRRPIKQKKEQGFACAASMIQATPWEKYMGERAGKHL